MIPGALLGLVRRFEGLRLKPYLCPAGVPTVGYGHTGADVKLDSPSITPNMAEALLIEDADGFVRAVLKASPTLAGNMAALAAISDFAFNLGTARYRGSTLRRKVEAGEWDEAQDELAKWAWGGGRKLPGLVVRRAAEAALL